MSGARIWSLAWAAVLVTPAGCASEAAVPHVSAQAGGVRVERGDPPAGAERLGPLSVSDGYGCGFGGERGTLEGATARLRAAAARRGADFVQVTSVTKPYSGHDCYHQAFTLTGMSYRLTPPALPSEVPASASSVAPPPAAFAVAAPSEPCAPRCSPGYACHVGVCEPECDPACPAGDICRADRVRVPAKTN